VQATFSCGMAALPYFITASSIIQAADAALLQAKRNGRNCLLRAEPESGLSVTSVEMEQSAYRGLQFSPFATVS